MAWNRLFSGGVKLQARIQIFPNGDWGGGGAIGEFYG